MSSTRKEGGTVHDDDRETKEVFETLVKYIEKTGGKVHESLELLWKNENGRGKRRGVYAKRKIVKGELLFRIPHDTVVSGDSLPYKWGPQAKVASPWLRCLAAWYKARHQEPTPSSYAPYIKSLPSTYETLWEWTNDEVHQYLAGTTLGSRVQIERDDGACDDDAERSYSDDCLQKRYQESVLPYLLHCNVLEGKVGKENPLAVFRSGCMCLSTRGFHMQQTNEAAVASNGKAASSEAYSGPFLIPIIDLLNHTEVNPVTRLQQEASSADSSPTTTSFCMRAQQDIMEGQEIVHSYGDTLTAAQILQTFGFVPESKIQRTIYPSQLLSHKYTTPAMLSKDHIIDACRKVAESDYSKKLKVIMDANDIDGEIFTPPKKVQRDTSFIADTLIVNAVNDDATSCLSDEMVTLCCIHLLPSDYYDEIFDESTRLLDKTVLEDYFLGKMVVMSLLTAIQDRYSQYQKVTSVPGIQHLPEKDEDLVKALLELEDCQMSAVRALYGLTVRLEEKKGLKMLQEELAMVIASLDDLDDDEDADVLDARATKKPKNK